MDNAKMNRLAALDEKALRDDVLAPLLARMDFKAVTIYHGPQERGKDIICYTTDVLGDREYLAIVAKTTDLNGSVTSSSSLREVLHQVSQCFDVPYDDLFGMKKVSIDKVWVVTSKKVISGAEQSIFDSVQKQNLSKLIRFISGEKLISLLDQYNPGYWDASLEPIDIVREQKIRLVRFSRQLLTALGGSTSDVESTINQVINSSFPPYVQVPATRELASLSPYRVELDKIDEPYSHNFHSNACGSVRETFFEARQTLYSAMSDHCEVVYYYDKVMETTDPRKFVQLFDKHMSRDHPFHRGYGKASDAVRDIGTLEEGINEMDDFIAHLRKIGKFEWTASLVDSVGSLEPDIRSFLEHLEKDEFSLFWRIDDDPKSPKLQLLFEEPNPPVPKCLKTTHTRPVPSKPWRDIVSRPVTTKEIISDVQVELRQYLDRTFPMPEEPNA